ncbi:4Fe-4S dicluster domain-containing protein [candidate division WOR-3 bacterium]|nr:4Fe-4S dicluster domain-containing protein [candidate division WOR-3 bacterium]MCK4333422.1 4Fe-4S dicluster domain-containing protein [candidate division WOR-3 bacterium]
MIELGKHTKSRRDILDKVERISEVDVFACYQCGRCSGDCPSISLMDIMPNQAIRLLQLGEVEAVLSSKTIWVCASCFTCTSRCPKGIDIARVLEALRQVCLRKNIDQLDLNNIPEEERERYPTIAWVSALRKLSG